VALQDVADLPTEAVAALLADSRLEIVCAQQACGAEALRLPIAHLARTAGEPALTVCLTPRRPQEALLLAQGLAHIMKPKSERERVSAAALEALRQRHAVVLHGAHLMSRDVRLGSESARA
jgi:hypothetical protein